MTVTEAVNTLRLLDDAHRAGVIQWLSNEDIAIAFPGPRDRVVDVVSRFFCMTRFHRVILYALYKEESVLTERQCWGLIHEMDRVGLRWAAVEQAAMDRIIKLTGKTNTKTT